MTNAEIIEAVRHCIDCETENTSGIAASKDDTYMDNIIVAKIDDARHWIAMTASQSPYLSADSKAEAATSTVTLKSSSVQRFTDVEEVGDVGVVTLPTSIEAYNVCWVRCSGWHKAAVPNEDTSDSALMMFDETAKGTQERPQAVVMRTSPLKILIQPYSKENEVSLSFIGVSSGNIEGGGVDVPQKLRSAFIYYIAYLLLSAYGDAKAQTMYNIAVQQLGASITTKG